MAAKKSAIEARQGHPEGWIDDAIRWGYKQLHHRAATKTTKAFSKFEKLAKSQGGSVNIGEKSRAASKAKKYKNTMNKYGSGGKMDVYGKKAGYRGYK